MGASTSNTRRRVVWVALLVLFVLAAGGYGLVLRAGGAARPEATAPAARPVPVVAAPARTRDMGVYSPGSAR